MEILEKFRKPVVLATLAFAACISSASVGGGAPSPEGGFYVSPFYVSLPADAQLVGTVDTVVTIGITTHDAYYVYYTDSTGTICSDGNIYTEPVDDDSSTWNIIPSQVTIPFAGAYVNQVMIWNGVRSPEQKAGTKLAPNIPPHEAAYDSGEVTLFGNS